MHPTIQRSMTSLNWQGKMRGPSDAGFGFYPASAWVAQRVITQGASPVGLTNGSNNMLDGKVSLGN
jgi:hypothetical protein